ncbi:family 16 glycoside hydrolase [Botrimarina hoheduenensis]|nr:family 16 glycoside hydrolase [Botrimarina hoheduenensis]
MKPIFVAVFCCSLLIRPSLGVTPASEEATVRTVATRQIEPAVGHDWIVLIGEEGAVGIAEVGKNLTECADVRLDPQTNRLETTPGAGVVAAVRKFAYGDANNLNSIREFGDCEVSLEFLLGKDSNSGVKLQQRYEVQLYDSRGKDQLSGTDCGGVYPHWVYAKNGKGITYIDEGVPPLANAAGVPGRWQTLRIVFTAPQFDQEGAKTRNARFVSVELNGGCHTGSTAKLTKERRSCSHAIRARPRTYGRAERSSVR